MTVPQHKGMSHIKILRISWLRLFEISLMVSNLLCPVSHINTHCSSNKTLYHFVKRYVFRSKLIIIRCSLQNLTKQGTMLLLLRSLKYYKIRITIKL